MERRKGRKQQQQLSKALLVEDEPVEYQCPTSSSSGNEYVDDDHDHVTDRNVRGSGVGSLDHLVAVEPTTTTAATKSSSFRPASDTDTDSAEDDSDEDYVAYGRVDVEAATDAVTGWLRQRLAPSATGDDDAAAAQHVQSGDDADSGGDAQQQQQQQQQRKKMGKKQRGEAQKAKQQALPLTRREWGRQEDVLRLCRVERNVEGLAVVGLLHQARLIRLLPPPTRTGASRHGEQHEGKDDGGGSSSKGEEEERQEGVESDVQGLDAEDVGQVGVEWVARPQDTARLEEVLTQQLGDGSIILARVLPWLRSRLASPVGTARSSSSSSSNGKRKKKAELPNGGKKSPKNAMGDRCGALPDTLRDLLATIEREQWGAITHRVRPNDVLHELELNELVEVEMERSGRLTYNKARILTEKKAGGNEWKWLLGILFLMLMTLPSWLGSLSSVLAWAS